MEALMQAMIRHEVPEVLVDWIEDMLGDRNLTQLGDTTIEGKPDDKGCPQGKVFSLFCGASW